MRILVIDGQGGGIGKQLVRALRASGSDAVIVACGTNGEAARGMKKAGADETYYGENSVVRECGIADVITGPVGIVMPGAIAGEVTAAAARAAASSRAVRVLVPIGKCNTLVAGATGGNLSHYIEEAARLVLSVCESNARAEERSAADGGNGCSADGDGRQGC